MCTAALKQECGGTAGLNLTRGLVKNIFQPKNVISFRDLRCQTGIVVDLHITFSFGFLVIVERVCAVKFNSITELSLFLLLFLSSSLK